MNTKKDHVQYSTAFSYTHKPQYLALATVVIPHFGCLSLFVCFCVCSLVVVCVKLDDHFRSRECRVSFVIYSAHIGVRWPTVASGC